MTDQTIPAGLTRDQAQAVREWAERARAAEVQDETVADAARVLLAVLPKPPTLADMSPEERRACQWMQADTESEGRVVITICEWVDGRAAVLDRRGDVFYKAYATVTPRPDLPRMAWPGTEKPATALPEGWRLADHEDHGRVIVTTQTPDEDGDVYFAVPFDDLTGYDWDACHPDELTFLDQEAADATD